MPLGSPLPSTPWLLIQEVRYHIGPELSITPLPVFSSSSFFPFMQYQPVTIQFHALCNALSRYFSTFAHATNSLSVICDYLELDIVLPIFAPHHQGVLLFGFPTFTRLSTRLSLFVACRSRHLRLRAKAVMKSPTSPLPYGRDSVRSHRLSIAYTNRIPIGFFSCGY